MEHSWRDWLASIFLVRPAADSRVPLAIWSLVAAVSVTLAVYLAMQPGQLGDLATVRSWLHYWFAVGANPYTHFGPPLDYPPMAFLMLWPLGLPSDATVAFWFLPTVLALTPLAVFAQLGWVSERLHLSLTTSQRIAFVAMVLSGGGARSGVWLGQTMALSMLFGALAMRWTPTRPWLAAVSLALCSFKLHIAAGFGLAILLVDGPAIVLAAGAIVLAASWAFALTVGESLVTIVADYTNNLLTLYDGPNRVRGMLSIRFVLGDLIGHYATATAVYVVLAVGSLAMMAILAKRRRADPLAQVYVAVASLLWSLSFLPHQLYNILLAAPALYLLAWPESGLIKHRDLRALVTGAYVMFGVLDVTRVVRWLGRQRPESDWLFWIGYNTSPLRPFALLLFILWRLYRRPPAQHARRLR